MKKDDLFGEGFSEEFESQSAAGESPVKTNGKQSNNTLLVVVIVSLLAIIVFLGAMVAMLMLQLKAEKKPEKTISIQTTVDDTKTKTDDSSSSGFFTNEVKKNDDGNKAGGAFAFVRGGYEFTCPAEYGVFYSEAVGGTVVYMDDVFQLKIVPREKSYSQTLSEIDTLTEKTLAAGGTILKEPSEVTVNGTKYIYFKMDLMGDKNLVIYAPSPVDDTTFGGQFAILNDEASDEELLAVLDSIVKTAVKTDKPDSTTEDLMKRETFIAPGESKESSTLKYKDTTINFNIPSRFYSDYVSDGEKYVDESFLTEHAKTLLDCVFYYKDFGFANAEELVECEVNDINYLINKDKYKVETMTVNGRTIYYVLADYKYDDTHKKAFTGATDVKDGIYLVRASIIDEDDEDIIMDEMKTFFEIEVK